jgi:LmbE family N-acetylglucosaminyl deacetylase
MKVLVIAPHPDDEVLGCGGTIAKHASQRDEVYRCVVTEAYPPEWTEDEINYIADSIAVFFGRKVDGKYL